MFEIVEFLYDKWWRIPVLLIFILFNYYFIAIIYTDICNGIIKIINSLYQNKIELEKEKSKCLK